MIAIRGDIILVSERGADIGALDAASRAYIYNSDGSLHATIQSPTPTFWGTFGWSLCFSGDTIVVSEPNVGIEGIPNAGKIHLFDSDGNYLETLQSPEPFAAAYFGSSMDGSEGFFVVGEPDTKVGDTRARTRTAWISQMSRTLSMFQCMIRALRVLSSTK